MISPDILGVVEVTMATPSVGRGAHLILCVVRYRLFAQELQHCSGRAAIAGATLVV